MEILELMQKSYLALSPASDNNDQSGKTCLLVHNGTNVIAVTIHFQMDLRAIAQDETHNWHCFWGQESVDRMALTLSLVPRICG